MKFLYSENLTKYLTLSVLIDFLKRKVIPRADKNKMNTNNISICFAPCLMWAEQSSLKDLLYIHKSVHVTTIMINDFEKVFGSKKELSKVFRNSYLENQKKSLSGSFNV